MISILINNYNYEDYLEEAIDSALSQTCDALEVIVVDDGSTDNSREIIRGYGEEVRAVFKENGGQASAFNAGFEVSKGEWILFLDADDVLDADCLLHLENYVATVDETVVNVQYKMRAIDTDGIEISEIPSVPARLLCEDPIPLINKNGKYGAAPTSGNIFKRSALAQILPMPTAGFEVCADLYLQISMPFHGKIMWVDERLASYRLHGRNRYGSRLKSKDMNAFALRARMRVKAFEVSAHFLKLFDIPLDPNRSFNETKAKIGIFVLERLQYGRFRSFEIYRKLMRELISSIPRVSVGLVLKEGIRITAILLFPGIFVRRLLSIQGE